MEDFPVEDFNEDFSPGFFDSFMMGDGFFTVFQILFPLFFILVFGIILFSIIKGFKQWNYNNKQPKLTVAASVVSKRAKHSHHHDNNHSSSHTTYYATFQVESGDRMELQVRGSQYGMLAEGDVGYLSFQGTRFLDFVRMTEEHTV